MEQYIEETKDALKWFEMNDISAYIDTDKTSIYVEVNNDTHILVSGSEVSYRADLYREHYKN
tara:strand:- start:1097 stop:1282 length:186 start_codon:yes stop_codon:yes gene_type:complete